MLSILILLTVGAADQTITAHACMVRARGQKMKARSTIRDELAEANIELRTMTVGRLRADAAAQLDAIRSKGCAANSGVTFWLRPAGKTSVTAHFATPEGQRVLLRTIELTSTSQVARAATIASAVRSTIHGLLTGGIIPGGSDEGVNDSSIEGPLPPVIVVESPPAPLPQSELVLALRAAALAQLPSTDPVAGVRVGARLGFADGWGVELDYSFLTATWSRDANSALRVLRRPISLVVSYEFAGESWDIAPLAGLVIDLAGATVRSLGETVHEELRASTLAHFGVRVSWRPLGDWTLFAELTADTAFGSTRIVVNGSSPPRYTSLAVQPAVALGASVPVF